MLQSIIRFTLFTSIFVALCAIGLCIETNLLLGIPLNHYSFYLFILGACLVQYNLHYLVKTKANSSSERFAWSQQRKPLHKTLIVVGIVCILVSFLHFSIRHYYILLVLGLIATLYSMPLLPFKKKRLKDYGLLKIIVLSLEWTLVTVWFPADEAGISPTLYWLVFIRRFIFMFVLCLLFDVRDMEGDAAENIHTLPITLGLRKTYLLAYLLLIVFVLLSVVHLQLNRNILHFNAMLLSAVATWIMTEYSKTHHNDYTYLAGIDGMMLLQAVLVMIASL